MMDTSSKLRTLEYPNLYLLQVRNRESETSGYSHVTIKYPTQRFHLSLE